MISVRYLVWWLLIQHPCSTLATIWTDWGHIDRGDLANAVISSVWDMVFAWRDIHCATGAGKPQMEVLGKVRVMGCTVTEAIWVDEVSEVWQAKVEPAMSHFKRLKKRYNWDTTMKE